MFAPCIVIWSRVTTETDCGVSISGVSVLVAVAALTGTMPSAEPTRGLSRELDTLTVGRLGESAVPPAGASDDVCAYTAELPLSRQNSKLSAVDPRTPVLMLTSQKRLLMRVIMIRNKL